MKRKTMRTLLCVAVVALMMTAMSVTAFAASGDVAGAVDNTWNAAKSQVQTVVNNVVFPDPVGPTTNPIGCALVHLKRFVS